MRTCCQCAAKFEPTGNGYRCLACRKAYDHAWRAARKLAGKPTGGAPASPEYHRAYDAAYSAKPDVRARRAERARARTRNPAERHKHEARWQTRRAIVAGKLSKQPCEVCGAPTVDAHHDDYSRPLDVRWLCRPHHREHHARQRAEAQS